MNKDDEMVWVFPACVLSKLPGLPGVTTNLTDWEIFKMQALPDCRFMRRGDVEDEPTVQQVIPYTVVRCADQVLVYNRGAKGGEKRLADKWSIGIGGHINPEDAQPGFGASPGRTLRVGAARELDEELTRAGSPMTRPLSHYIKALLKSEDSAVDAVHFGVVMEAFINSTRDVEGSEEVEFHKWVDFEELEEYELESWSQKVYESLYKEE